MAASTPVRLCRSLSDRSCHSTDSYVHAFRRLSDLLAETSLLEAQLQIFQEASGPHHVRDVVMRITTLHRRLDEIESQLRLRARKFGEGDQATMRDLRRRLAALDRVYLGPERRKHLQARLDPSDC
jgi:hypothetical protein